MRFYIVTSRGVSNSWSSSSTFLTRIQKQLLADVLQNRCCEEFCNIHRETPVLESLFNKVAGLRSATLLKENSSTGAFLWILRNFWEHLIWRTFANGCFWIRVRNVEVELSAVRYRKPLVTVSAVSKRHENFGHIKVSEYPFKENKNALKNIQALLYTYFYNISLNGLRPNFLNITNYFS